VVEARVRHARQQFCLVDGSGQFFGKPAQTGERAARIDVQYILGKTGGAGQQLVAGAEELEVYLSHVGDSSHIGPIARTVPVL
ncbi:hypothetical protein ACV34H_33855, partial [Pseudomonas aeruginosa]